MTTKTLNTIKTHNNTIMQIILNNPEKHNAFDEHLIQHLLETLESIEQDDTIRVVILSAEGASFSAGADLNWMKKMAAYSEQENMADAMKLARLMQKLNHLNKPTIALIQGNAFGGALGLIACCDIALSVPSALFCFSEVKLGLIPAVISPYVLAAIGERMSRRYFLTAERFSAEEALRIELIHQIVEKPENLIKTGLHLAENIANNSPEAIKKIKALTHEVTQKTISENVIQKTAKAIAKARVSSDGQEGLSAFLEKRTAKWVIKENE